MCSYPIRTDAKYPVLQVSMKFPWQKKKGLESASQLQRMEGSSLGEQLDKLPRDVVMLLLEWMESKKWNYFANQDDLWQRLKI